MFDRNRDIPHLNVLGFIVLSTTPYPHFSTFYSYCFGFIPRNMAMLDNLPTSFFFRLLIVLSFYVLLKWIYRLTLHPLARFPGPKLAAVSSLYGAYFDLGTDHSYVKDLPALHDQYGLRSLSITTLFSDVVQARSYGHGQINSTYAIWILIISELLLRIDSSLLMLFRIFKIGTKFDKDTNFYANPSLNGSFFNIPDTRTALARRSLFSSSFSMEAIRNAEPLIMEVIDKFFGILHGAALEAKVVDLEMGFRCLTSDSIMTFMFQNPLGVLDAPDFQAPFISAIEEFSQTTQWPIYFPKIFSVIFQTTEILPSKFIEKYLEPLALTQWLTSVS